MVFVESYSLPPVNPSEVFRYAACPSVGEAESSLLAQCLSEADCALRAQVCWANFPISLTDTCLDLSFAKTDASALRRHLSGCESVILFAATIGLGIDRLIARYSRLSPARALLFQALGAERIECLCDVFCADMRQRLAQNGKHLTKRFSPGYGNLPLTLQTDIFRALDCPRTIGLSLTDSLLMMPSKSVTALIGVSASPTVPFPDGCAVCQKTDCNFRG